MLKVEYRSREIIQDIEKWQKNKGQIHKKTRSVLKS